MDILILHKYILDTSTKITGKTGNNKKKNHPGTDDGFFFIVSLVFGHYSVPVYYLI